MMESTTEPAEGWVELTHEAITLVMKGDETLRARVAAALAEAPDDDPVDVVLDELSSSGIRRTPAFALVDAGSGRALVRGTGVVRLTGAEAGPSEIVAPARGPWADEDLPEGVSAVVVGTTEVVEPEPAAPEAPAAPAGGGWAMPSVFGSRPALSVVPPAAAPAPANVPEPEPAPEPEPVAEPEPVQPAEPDAEVQPVETPADVPAPEPVEPPAEDAPAAGTPDDEGEDELPSFDFLFGNTSHHRSSLSAEGPEDAIDAGPVAAAGGFQAPEPAANATLAPPSDDEPMADRPAPAHPAPEADQLPELPPLPGAVAPARDDVPSGEPQVVYPQFGGDGHLVGSRVPTGDGEPAPAALDAVPSAAPQPAQDDGLIAAVPWGQGGGAPFGLPSFGDPGHDPHQAAPAHEPAPTSAYPAGAAEDASAPVVLAVRCHAGHLSAPHATRCRVCQQQLPEQEPEQLPRPALGQLRLSTGDVVALDRGVLLGRAPKAASDLAHAQPHLVRVSSPDNEISRNHAEIILDGWHVLVRDLGSTNGTTVALPGSSPVRVRPGDQQTIEPGTTITLADQVSMVFEVTG